MKLKKDGTPRKVKNPEMKKKQLMVGVPIKHYEAAKKEIKILIIEKYSA